MKNQKKSLSKLSLFTLAAVLTFFSINNASSQTEKQIIEKALASTVFLKMQDKDGSPLGSGSGFFVRPDLIATNYHVIEGAAHGTVKLVHTNTPYAIAGITGIDKVNDLALIQINSGVFEMAIFDVMPLPLGDSDTVRPGEKVFVIGNPMDLEGTISEGVISGRRNTGTRELLQMSAPISPGSSGGPVLNHKGDVIGVSVGTHTGADAQNLNFAIPSKHLKTLLNRSGTAKSFSDVGQPISANTYLIWAAFRYGGGDHENAIAFYDASIRLDPNRISAYYLRGIAKSQIGRYSDAIADYDIATHLDPNYDDAYYHRGMAKSEIGRYSDAIADYDTVIHIDPDSSAAYYRRGILKANLGQYSDAIIDYNTAIRRKPNILHISHNAEIHYHRGIAKAKLGQYIGAIVDYNAAIRLKPDYTYVYLARGIAKADLGKHFAAIDDYNIAIDFKPNDAEAYYYRGAAKAKLGRHFAALADYDTAIILKSDFAKAYHDRGVTKASLGQYFDAITDYNIAIRLKPDDILAYYNRGLAKGKFGSYWEAKQDLMTALKLLEPNRDESLKVKIKELLQDWD